MVKICTVCNSRIDEYDYYRTEDKKHLLCSEECVSLNSFQQDIFHVRKCSAYEYCDKLDDLRKMCVHTKKYESHPLLNNPSDYPRFCSLGEVSNIISSVKLYEFVKKSEEEASILNKETLDVSKSNVRLAKVMLFVSVVNLVCVVFQIVLLFFIKNFFYIERLFFYGEVLSEMWNKSRR